MKFWKSLLTHEVFFFLFLLFTSTQLGKHFWPDWTVILGRRIDYLSPTLYFSDLLLVTTIGLWIRNPLIFFRNYVEQHKKYWLSALLLLCLVVLTVGPAKEKFLAIFGWITYFKLFFIIWYVSSAKPSWTKISVALSMGVVMNVALGIVQTTLQQSVGGLFWFLGERTFSVNSLNIAKSVVCIPGTATCWEILRPYGTFSHPNVFAGYVSITLFCILITLKKKRPSLTLPLVRFLHIALLVGFIGLIVSLSRSAWIATTLGVILFKVKDTPRKILVLIVGAVFIGIKLYTPIDSLRTSEPVLVRTQLASASLQMIRTYPFFGVGVYNFLPSLPYYLPLRVIYFLQPVHSIYLLFLSEFGFVGSVVMIAFAFSIIKGKLKKIMSLPYSIPLFVLLCIGLFDHYPLTIQQGQFLFALSIAFVTLQE